VRHALASPIAARLSRVGWPQTNRFHLLSPLLVGPELAKLSPAANCGLKTFANGGFRVLGKHLLPLKRQTRQLPQAVSDSATVYLLKWRNWEPFSQLISDVDGGWWQLRQFWAYQAA
jgi:hypothetical protein